MKFHPLTNDYVFKKVFTAHPEELGLLLRDPGVLPPGAPVPVILNPGLEPSAAKGRRTVLDIRAEAGRMQINVEMQGAREPGIWHRQFLYTARMFDQGIPEGDDLSDPRKAASLLIANFKAEHPDLWLAEYVLCRRGTEHVHSDGVTLWAVHLPDIPKDDMSPAAVRLRVFTARSEEELMSMEAAHPEVSGLVRGVIELHRGGPACIEADLRDKARREEPARMNGAVRETSLKTASSLLEMGLDPASVAKATELSPEDAPAPARKPHQASVPGHNAPWAAGLRLVSSAGAAMFAAACIRRAAGRRPCR